MEDHGTDGVCNETYTTSEKNSILIIAGSNATISFCMCVVAVSLVLCLRLYKIDLFTYRLATYQVLGGMMFSFGAMLYFGSINYNRKILLYVIVCKAQAFVTTYFLWVKLFFTISLIFHLLCFAIFMKNFKKLELFYVLFSTLFPLLFTWIPFIHDNYDIAGAWCWIRDWKDNCASHRYLEGIIEQFALWYGPLSVFLIISVTITSVIFVVLLWRTCKLLSDEDQPLLKEKSLQWQQKKILRDLVPLLAYPSIFSIISLVPIINRVYNAVSHSPSYDLSVIHAITNFSMGFFSGTTLIIHVLVAKFYKQKSPALKDTTVPVVINKNKIEESATDCTTQYLIPPESEIDKMLHSIQ